MDRKPGSDGQGWLRMVDKEGMMRWTWMRDSRRFFQVLAIGLVVILFGWVVYVMGVAGFGGRELREVLGVSAGALEGVALPLDTVQDELERVRHRMLSLHRSGSVFAVVDDVLGWGAFVVMSGITLVAAFFGRTLNAARDVTLPEGAARAIGVLAALGAVLSMGSSVAASEAAERLARAAAISADARATRQEIEEETTDAAAERELLDQLWLTTER